MSQDYGVDLYNCYGKDLFESLEIGFVWDEII